LRLITCTAQEIEFHAQHISVKIQLQKDSSKRFLSPFDNFLFLPPDAHLFRHFSFGYNENTRAHNSYCTWYPITALRFVDDIRAEGVLGLVSPATFMLLPDYFIFVG
jgi:hypothetical protein